MSTSMPLDVTFPDEFLFVYLHLTAMSLTSRWVPLSHRIAQTVSVSVSVSVESVALDLAQSNNHQTVDGLAMIYEVVLLSCYR